MSIETDHTAPGAGFQASIRFYANRSAPGYPKRMTDDIGRELERTAGLIARSRRLIAFTGAGISAESGVRTFRGDGGLWNEIDPGLLEIGRFNSDPAASWEAIRALFYVPFPDGTRPAPNAAHRVLAEWERDGILSFVVTQNIDGLHYAAGSRKVSEFHGSVRELACRRCGARFAAGPEELAAGLLDELPPRCAAPGAGGGRCGGVLKPDFVFFGEGIPPAAYESAFSAAARADACLVVGSTGVVYPAANVPFAVKRSGGTVIEVDPGLTEFSAKVADVHLRLGAVEALTRLDELVRARRGA
jgi:NAD-dependent deacetylase